jgi:hypothetical protein
MFLEIKYYVARGDIWNEKHILTLSPDTAQREDQRNFENL